MSENYDIEFHNCEQKKEWQEVARVNKRSWYVSSDSEITGEEDQYLYGIKHCPFCGVKLDES